MAKNSTKERKGIIIRFDALPTLEKLGADAQGAFLMAVLRYGKHFETPNFDDISGADAIRLDVLWEQTKPYLDEDAAGWKDGILQRSYAGYRSSHEQKDSDGNGSGLDKETGKALLTYDEYRVWKLTNEEKDTAELCDYDY